MTVGEQTEPATAEPTRGTFWQRAVRRRKGMPFWQETLLLVVVAFFLAVLVRTFAFQAFVIPGDSMSGTLRVGDRVLVNKLVYDVRSPHRGEIVVFRGTSTWTPEIVPDGQPSFAAQLGTALGDLVGISAPDQNDFVKRVIGLPGDTVTCCDGQGRVTVNGTPLDEPYVTDNAPLDTTGTGSACGTRRFAPVTVPAGEMFVLGDHRVDSEDSRCAGLVPLDHVIGRAIAVVWPGGRFASLDVPATFARIRAPASAAGGLSAVPADVSGVPLVAPVVAVCGMYARISHRRRPRRRTLRG